MIELNFCRFNLKSASKVTKRSPCTNRPILCKICEQCYWSYNIKNHYKDAHMLIDCAEEAIPSQFEIECVLKK